MAIAHICQRCGIDLAFVRACREPHYGLMIVRCPDCGRVCARRRHPLWQFWRTLRRVDWALTVLVVNLLALAAAFWIMLASVGWTVFMTSDLSPVAFLRGHPYTAAAALLLAPLVVGAYLTAGLGHWRRRTAWITFAALVMAGLTVGWAGNAFDEALRWRSRSGGAWPPADLWLAEPLGMWIRSAALLLMLMLVALAGVAPGQAALAGLRLGRRAIFRIRRRRQRRDRAT